MVSSGSTVRWPQTTQQLLLSHRGFINRISLSRATRVPIISLSPKQILYRSLRWQNPENVCGRYGEDFAGDYVFTTCIVSTELIPTGKVLPWLSEIYCLVRHCVVEWHHVLFLP